MVAQAFNSSISSSVQSGAPIAGDANATATSARQIGGTRNRGGAANDASYMPTPTTDFMKGANDEHYDLKRAEKESPGFAQSINVKAYNKFASNDPRRDPAFYKQGKIGQFCMLVAYEPANDPEYY